MHILSTMGALIVFIMMIPMFTGIIDQGMVNIQKRQAADHLATVNHAAAVYVKKHHATLLSQASPTGGPMVRVAELVSEGLLPVGFRDRNVWGQSYQIYIRKPAQDSLQAIVLTTGGRGHEPGSSFGTAVVPSAAALVGGSGGYIPTGDLPGQPAGTLHGAGGGWSISLAGMGIPSSGAGHMGALAVFDSSALGQDYLYRIKVPGHPELNAMQTELDMARHAVRNVSEIQFTPRDITTEACAAPEEQGRVFLDRVQGLYLCRNNKLEVIGDTGNSAQIRRAMLAKNGDKIEKPICPASTGTAPMIFVAPSIAEAGPQAPPISSFQAWATSVSDTEWQVHMRVLTADKSLSPDGSGWVYPSPAYGRIMVTTLCARDTATP